MTARIFSIDPVVGFVPVTLTGHRNAIVNGFFQLNSLQVSLWLISVWYNRKWVLTRPVTRHYTRAIFYKLFMTNQHMLQVNFFYLDSSYKTSNLIREEKIKLFINTVQCNEQYQTILVGSRIRLICQTTRLAVINCQLLWETFNLLRGLCSVILHAHALVLIWMILPEFAVMLRACFIT